MGTYNYYGPDQTELHKKYDVDSYLKWRNIKVVTTGPEIIR